MPCDRQTPSIQGVACPGRLEHDLLPVLDVQTGVADGDVARERVHMAPLVVRVIGAVPTRVEEPAVFPRLAQAFVRVREEAVHFGRFARFGEPLEDAAEDRIDVPVPGWLVDCSFRTGFGDDGGGVGFAGVKAFCLDDFPILDCKGVIVESDLAVECCNVS